MGRRLGHGILWILVCVVSAGAQGVITTFAGSQWIYRNDSGMALTAPLSYVQGAVTDRAGNVLVADSYNHIVVRITPDGRLSIVAGNGIAGFSGDGGPATSASLVLPYGLALDSAGNLYIATAGSGRIRRVTPSGIIGTVVGSGRLGASGDGGPATAATTNFPEGVAVDLAGNLYVADTLNHRVRKVDRAGIITTLAGIGVAGLSGDNGPAIAATLNEPAGLAVDSAGNVYVVDRKNNCIRKISAAGVITTVVGGGTAAVGDGGPATAARLSYPCGVAVTADGTLYIADSGHRIRKVTPNGIISTVAGNGQRSYSGDRGPATQAAVNQPEGVAVDAAGNIFISDTFNYVVRKVDVAGIITTVAGSRTFKFGGDGDPAISASLNSPQSLALDSSGNLFISDMFNHRVRKVSPKGIITTVLGNGVVATSGDGGPATSASINETYGVAADRFGNLYVADSTGYRVRKVAPNGIVTTVAGGGSGGDGGPATAAFLSMVWCVAVDSVGNFYFSGPTANRVRKVAVSSGILTTFAGNGVAAYAGDNGPATQASLNYPYGLAFDQQDNLYIADQSNQRVRKVTTAGIITTVAGSGKPGYSGDNGQATAAALADPRGVVVDALGNLYISNEGSGHVRKVAPNGVISTVAGNGAYGTSGDGGPGAAAALSYPGGLAVDSVGNLYISDSGADRIRMVLAAAPSFTVAPARLTFSAAAGAAAVAAQQISVASTVSGLTWNAAAATESGGAWLAVSPPAGAAPGATMVSVNLAGLSPGSYRGSVTMVSPLAKPMTQTVPVDLTVQAAAQPQLTAEPASLTFEVATGSGDPSPQTVRVGNGGGGTLAWTARAETASGNWLSVSPASGNASAGSPSSVLVSAKVAGLAPGVYSGAVKLESPATGQAQTVTVSLLLAQLTQTILVSQTGLQFTGVGGGTAAPSQSIGVLNIGQGAMSWTATASTLSGGNWLSVSPASGRSDAGSLVVPMTDVNVDVTGLKPGQYSGLIRIEAASANNSPQSVTVDLNVLPAGTNPGPLVRPTGLIFAARAGTSSPGSQTVRLATAVPGRLEVRGGLLTFDGANWLDVVPRNPVVAPAEPRDVTVQPTLGSLAAGVYRGALTFLFADGSPSQVVDVLFVVFGGQAGAAGREPWWDAEADADTATCTPQRLQAVQRSLGSNFSTPAGWASPIEVQVVDDCGAPATAATVVASFSNGDPPLPLASLRNGTYVATWRPGTASGQVVVTVRAIQPPLAQAEVQARGSVGANATAPALYSGGIVNGASFAAGGAVAPGSIVAVFGRNLASGLNYAVQKPLETTLGGATLNIGGRDAPLFFSSDGQINAQVPFELVPNTRHSAVVKTRRDAAGPETYAVPESLTVAAAQPGIFTVNQQGTGQGVIMDVKNQLVDAGNPVTAGDVVVIYCTGMGATQPTVVSGQAAPSAEPLAHVAGPVTATVGGKPAVVQFAGLTPGFIGLYQVNVQIPEGVTAGSAVPLVVTSGGVPSNTVTLGIR